MQIVHFSDTHLGFNDLDILNESGINQREADFYDAFSQVVAQIKHIKPDFIIHTGDLFHRPSPSNRAIAFALEQFRAIDALNIPFVLIGGNHSTPRTSASLPILKIFEGFENIYVAYNQAYQKFEFEEVVFHALPHMNDESNAILQIDLCEKSINPNKKNIMMMHCSVGAYYLMDEFGEWVYPKDKEHIFKKMDYVALGHWHGFKKVEKHDNVYYAGSTERTSLNDKRNSKGFALVDLNEALHVEYKEIAIRPIISVEIDCQNFDKSIDALHVNTKDALVEVKLVNLTPLQSIDIQTNQIKDLFKDALHVSVKREFIEQSGEKLEDVKAFSLEELFLEHIQKQSDAKEFDRLKLKVQELFASYEEQSDDSN